MFKIISQNSGLIQIDLDCLRCLCPELLDHIVAQCVVLQSLSISIGYRLDSDALIAPLAKCSTLRSLSLSSLDALAVEGIAIALQNKEHLQSVSLERVTVVKQGLSLTNWMTENYPRAKLMWKRD